MTEKPAGTGPTPGVCLKEVSAKREFTVASFDVMYMK